MTRRTASTSRVTRALQCLNAGFQMIDLGLQAAHVLRHRRQHLDHGQPARHVGLVDRIQPIEPVSDTLGVLKQRLADLQVAVECLRDRTAAASGLRQGSRGFDRGLERPEHGGEFTEHGSLHSSVGGTSEGTARPGSASADPGRSLTCEDWDRHVETVDRALDVYKSGVFRSKDHQRDIAVTAVTALFGEPEAAS